MSNYNGSKLKASLLVLEQVVLGFDSAVFTCQPVVFQTGIFHF